MELPDFRGESGDLLATRTTSPRLVGRLNLLGAEAVKVAVPTGAIVERIDVVGDVRQRDVAARIDRFLMRPFFKLLKSDSAMALSQQFPFRLILGSR